MERMSRQTLVRLHANTDY